MTRFGYFAAWALVVFAANAHMERSGRKCTVYPENDADDTPAIREAFEECGVDGVIDFPEDHTYHIEQVLNTTGLRNCEVHIRSTLEWGKDTDYWIANSHRLDFQDQSTAWLFGGKNVSMFGYNKAIFFGNGQTWYDQNRNRANQFGRPISLTVTDSNDLSIDGISFIQSQFWSNFIIYSDNVRMTNINVKSISSSRWGTVNTDGTNTWNANKVLYENWVVENGDDCIAIKGNSTNILGRNITCRGGGSGGLPIGSIGQYEDRPDYVTNVTFTDIKLEGVFRGVWIKTWPGVNRNGPANGDDGGGGRGVVSNVVYENVVMDHVNMPIFVTQCTYVDDSDICDTSKLHLKDVIFRNITGTSTYNMISSLHCSAASPCPGFRFEHIKVKPAEPNPRYPPLYRCANIIGQDTDKTHIPCNAYAPAQFQGGVWRNLPVPKEGFTGKAIAISSDAVTTALRTVDRSLMWSLGSFWVTGRAWGSLRSLFE